MSVERKGKRRKKRGKREEKRRKEEERKKRMRIERSELKACLEKWGRKGSKWKEVNPGSK